MTGVQTCALPIYVDLLPTFVAAAGGTLQAPNPLDGMNVLPQIEGAVPESRAFYPDRNAVVTPRWKLVGEELYDLEADPGETTDVAAQQPRVWQEMRDHLARFQALDGAPYVPPGLPEHKTTVLPDWGMVEVGVTMGEP